MHEDSSWSPTAASDAEGEAAFQRIFGTAPDGRGDAPGRVSLLGEPGDAHGGFVLATVLPQRTTVALRRREDRTVRAYSVALGGEADVFTIGTEQPGRGWLDYVQGVTCVLREHGVLPPGFDVRIDSTLPVGAGVSSSAALVVSLFRALRTLCDLPVGDREIARLAHRVETHFVGAPGAVADSMVCSLGRPGQVLLVDTREHDHDVIAWPSAADLVVVDPGVPQALVGNAYVSRRESFQAAAALGVEHLRAVGIEALPAIETLADPLARRARHVVTENQRVLAAGVALRDGDVETLGRLLATSHASLRDDFEITSPEIDRFVTVALADPAILGARLTGGGAGGAVVMLARAGEGRVAAERIVDACERQHGRRAAILSPPLRFRAAG